MPKSAVARSVLIACMLLAAGVLAVVGWRLLERSDGEAGGAGGIASIGGPFALTDQNGAPRTDAEFRGQLMLVFFGFTHCPDICPIALQTIGSALDELGAAGEKVTPIFITVDPARDTVAQLKDYVGSFHPRLVALTGSEAEIAAVAKAYRVYYAKADAGGATAGDAYQMGHSGIVYVLGRDGRYLTHFTPEDSAATIAETLREYL